MARKKECNECGNLKEENYMNDSLCKSCRSLSNKIKRAKARETKGLPPYGSGRSPYCSKCGKEKDKQHQNGGYCRKCSSERRKKATTKKRLEKGLMPWGSGLKKLTCCRCNAYKENPNDGYCRACAREQDREWRLKTGRTKSPRTGLCKCGKPYASYTGYLCADCATTWRREYLKNNPDIQEKVFKAQKERLKNNPDEKFKYHARQMVHNAVRSGYLTKQPCIKCGEEKVDAHHNDYTKPLEVIWLCRKHHLEHHKNLNQEN